MDLDLRLRLKDTGSVLKSKHAGGELNRRNPNRSGGDGTATCVPVHLEWKGASERYHDTQEVEAGAVAKEAGSWLSKTAAPAPTSPWARAGHFFLLSYLLTEHILPLFMLLGLRIFGYNPSLIK